MSLLITNMMFLLDVIKNDVFYIFSSSSSNHLQIFQPYDQRDIMFRTVCSNLNLFAKVIRLTQCWAAGSWWDCSLEPGRVAALPHSRMLFLSDSRILYKNKNCTVLNVII